MCRHRHTSHCFDSTNMFAKRDICRSVNIYKHPTDFDADIRALFFDNRLAVSSKHVPCFVDFRSDFY